MPDLNVGGCTGWDSSPERKAATRSRPPLTRSREMELGLRLDAGGVGRELTDLEDDVAVEVRSLTRLAVLRAVLRERAHGVRAAARSRPVLDIPHPAVLRRGNLDVGRLDVGGDARDVALRRLDGVVVVVDRILFARGADRAHIGHGPLL